MTFKEFAKIGSSCAVVTLGLVLTHGIASASIIGTGSLNLSIAGTGNVFVTGNGVTTGCLDFNRAGQNITACQPSGSTGDFIVTGGTSPFASLQPGTIQDVPPNTQNLVDFLTIATPTPVFFDLTSIQSSTTQKGTCGLTGDTAANDSCQLANSPFVLVNVGNSSNVTTGVSITFAATLAGYTGTSASGSTPFNAIFSTQLSGATISSVLTAFVQNGSISSSWSASLSSTSSVPEPGTFVLLGSALLGIGGIIRRNIKKA